MERDNQWTGPEYTPNQIEAVLRDCKVEVVSETGTNFLCYCPFHGNTHTPSFSVHKKSGGYLCFNPSCEESGNIVSLIMKQTGKNVFEATRLLLKRKSETNAAFVERLEQAFEEKRDFIEFPQESLDAQKVAFWQNSEAQEYMYGRGFTNEILDYFDVGYSFHKKAQKGFITVPMHDPKGMPVGLIGRAFPEKEFKNSAGLPRKNTFFNLHRARKCGDTVIIAEASFDVMRIHQAGYPNVIAILGGHLSPTHYSLLLRYFSTIIIMTDFDKKESHIYVNCKKCKAKGAALCLGHNPGRDIGEALSVGLSSKKVMWASYDTEVVYPDDAKDAGELTDDQIRQCFRNAVNDYIYHSWNLY